MHIMDQNGKTKYSSINEFEIIVFSVTKCVTNQQRIGYDPYLIMNYWIILFGSNFSNIS